MNAQEQKLEHIILRMRSDTSVDAPADALKYAKNLFRTRIQAPVPTILRRLTGILKIDLAPGRVAFGERSTGSGAARQMLFDSGENAIDLRITATDRGFDIRGQILGDGFETGEVSLACQTVKIDEMGSFTFRSVTSGEYSMTVRGRESEIVVGKLILN